PNELYDQKHYAKGSTSANGSASAPATPTRVQLKRGRTSRRTTDSVPVPSPVTSDAVPIVALSGVWNVFSKEANRTFQSADLQEVEELCRMAELENKDADVVEILNMLADKSRKAPLTDVVDELYILLSTLYPLLKIKCFATYKQR
ncbi:hypothetical protein BGX27_000234, partial [Mortierella sp. AM989]